MPPVNVLTSLVGYGAFIPALCSYHRLHENGYTAQMQAIEHFYAPEKKAVFAQTGEAFRQNIKLARIASGLSQQFDRNITEQTAAAILQNWKETGVTRFLCFSGLWVNLLQQYATQCPVPPKIVCCRVDAGFSSAWKNREEPESQYGHFTSFFSTPENRIRYILEPGSAFALPWAEREPQILLHGGGWFLGNYAAVATGLPAHFRVLVIQKHDDAALPANTQITALPQLPDWDPLHNAEDLYRFPPFAQAPGNRPALWPRLANCRAVVAKPGGMTLMDALVTATPLVMLEPAGKNEADNAQLWQTLNLGIGYQAWAESGFSEAVLHEIYLNLLKARESAPDFFSCIQEQLLN